jgi:hypothetical protein
MIKLSLFMLDPVKAHEQYVKEIALLNAKLVSAEESAKLAKKELKSMRKATKEKVRQMGCQIAAMQKLEDMK